MSTIPTAVVNSNLRIILCTDTGKEVVQIRDEDEEDGWLCCHNDDIEQDSDDVSELRKYPTGEQCVWTNPFLQKLQREDPTYELG